MTDFKDLKERNEQLHYEEKQLQPEICRSMPVQLTISDTTICNLDCIMCKKNTVEASNRVLRKLKKIFFFGRIINRINNLRKQKNETMDFALFEKIANEVFPYIKYLYPTVNGEPFLNKNFFRELELAEKFKVKMSFFTNATFIPKDDELERIMRSLYELIISFDAAHKESYEKIRRFADYHKVIANIKRLNHARKKVGKDSRIVLTLKLVLMRSNIEELCDWVKLAKDLGADSILVSHVLIFDRKLLNESLVNHKELANYHLKKARSLAEELNLRIEEFPPLYAEKGAKAESVNDNQPCSFLWKEAFIELDGRVFPCCASIKDGLLMGNVKNTSFEQIWNGPEYQKLRASFKSGKMLPQCNNCFHRRRLTSSDCYESFILCK